MGDVVPTLSKNEANLCENVQGVSRRVRVFSRGRGQSERRLHGGEDSVHADVSVLHERRRKVGRGSSRFGRRGVTANIDERFRLPSEEEEKEEKENAKIIAQPGPGTIKDKKTN